MTVMTQNLNVTAIRRLSPIAAALLSVSLIGCTHEHFAKVDPNFDLIHPAERHPILVSQKPSTLSVSVAKGSSGLTPKTRAELLSFAQRYRAGDAGDSKLVVAAPSGSGNEIAAMHAVQEIRGLLVDNGFAESSVTVEAYNADHEAQPPVRVSYMRYVAEGPECGHWPTNLAWEPNNLPMPNLGCANQRNLAAMVQNPGDLIGPRATTARSNERRDEVWQRYQKGQPTASQKNEDGRVSTQGGGS
ncbi:MAG: CpaD family pilus assembly protein [Hyphomicrobiaceae bacterium]|nr:CpaD family pilus assembly protein [Hyphomicrobiaceae bacterium]